jgi:N-acyl-D-amino-acid deacylase
MSTQGVTTLVIGNCGSSAPLKMKKEEKALSDDLDPDWRDVDWNSMSGYFSKLERTGLLYNVVSFVGHSTVRMAVMEDSNTTPSKEELEEMKRLVAEAMEDGAFGLSSGLNIPPGNRSSTGEIIELCKVVAEYGGIYAIHLRDYAKYIREGIEEAIEIARATHVPVNFPHYGGGFRASITTDEVIQMIDQGREEGLELTIANYPYLRGCPGSPIGALLQLSYTPLPILEGDIHDILNRLKDPETSGKLIDHLRSVTLPIDFERLTVLNSEANPQLAGKTVAEIAEIRGIRSLQCHNRIHN